MTDRKERALRRRRRRQRQASDNVPRLYAWPRREYRRELEGLSSLNSQDQWEMLEKVRNRYLRQFRQVLKAEEISCGFIR